MTYARTSSPGIALQLRQEAKRFWTLEDATEGWRSLALGLLCVGGVPGRHPSVLELRGLKICPASAPSPIPAAFFSLASPHASIPQCITIHQLDIQVSL